MVFSVKVDILGFCDRIRQHFRKSVRGCASEGLPIFEQLEARVLLSGDSIGLAPIDLFQDIHEQAIVVDLVSGGGDVEVRR